MRLIAGLLPCSEGQVVVAGKPVVGPETNVGIVFQTAVLLEWRTIIENVLLQVEMRGLKPLSRYRERAEHLLAAVGLAGFQGNFPHELSGGMQQRAGIVRALIHDPPRLLMDEPFGALDALTREQVRVDLEDLWLSARKTVLFITHSIEEAILLSDRVVVMSARPGTIDRIIEVDLPRPRGLKARREPEFIRLCEEITDIFLSRGVLSARRNLLGPVVVS
jgi:NitT/TauT family transport system ATP-binding protein